MKKIKRLICLIVILSIIPSVSIRAFSAKEHNKYLKDVLFGEETVKNTDVMDALNDVSALAIDQHNGDGENTLKELKKLGIHGLPSSVKKFNIGHGKLHRNYTHKGWTYDYKANGGDDAHWSDIRKKMILKTVNQSFNFGFMSGKFFSDYDEQCEGLAALIYYVHVLGDHIYNEHYNSKYKEIPLVKGDGEFGIIEELEKYSSMLFSDHSSRTYTSYISELESIKDSVDDIYTSAADLEDEEVYAEYHQYAIDIMDCLKEYIPLLLKKETFFQEVFYPELVE